MGTEREKARTWDASDLKELMDNTGGWATSWDDVLWYLKGPAVYDADFAKNETLPLVEAVRKLEQEHFKFTTDYREMWHAITGESTTKLSPPEGVKSHGLNPREIEGKWLKGLEYPAKKEDIVRRADRNKAPQQVLGYLQKIEAKSYHNVHIVIEAIGDVSWDHD